MKQQGLKCFLKRFKAFFAKAKKRQMGRNFTKKVVEYDCLLLEIQTTQALESNLKSLINGHASLFLFFQKIIFQFHSVFTSKYILLINLLIFIQFYNFTRHQWSLEDPRLWKVQKKSSTQLAKQSNATFKGSNSNVQYYWNLFVELIFDFFESYRGA